MQEVTEVLKKSYQQTKKRKTQVWWDTQNYPGKKIYLKYSCTAQVSLLISSRVLFFFLLKLDKDMSTLPTSKSYCYISNSSSIHYSFTDLEFHLANKLLLKIFREVPLVTFEMSS